MLTKCTGIQTQQIENRYLIKNPNFSTLWRSGDSMSIVMEQDSLLSSRHRQYQHEHQLAHLYHHHHTVPTWLDLHSDQTNLFGHSSHAVTEFFRLLGGGIKCYLVLGLHKERTQDTNMNKSSSTKILYKRKQLLSLLCFAIVRIALARICQWLQVLLGSEERMGLHWQVLWAMNEWSNKEKQK